MSKKSYITTLDNVTAFLEEHGVAIIPNILSSEEVSIMQNGMWNILEDVTKNFDTPIDRRLPETWSEFYKLYPLHSMLLQHYGIGHHQEVWNIRQNEKVCEIFSTIWKEEKENMVTSFDGISIHLPHEVTKRGYYRGNEWFHTDQSYQRNDLECVQGFVTAFDVKDGDATLTFLSESHKYHGEVANKFNLTNKSNWHQLNDAELDYYKDKGCEKECITAPAGSIILWDSRLIHAGKEALKDRIAPNFRFVVYVCQLPSSLLSDKERRRKIKAFEERRVTSHWPHKVRLFPKTPRTYGGVSYNINIPDEPTLSPLGRSLVGFE